MQHAGALIIALLVGACGAPRDVMDDEPQPWPLAEEAVEQPPTYEVVDDPYWGKLLSLRYVDQVKENWANIGCYDIFNGGIPQGYATYAYRVIYANDYEKIKLGEPSYLVCRRGHLIDCIRYPMCDDKYFDMWRYDVYFSFGEKFVDMTLMLEVDHKSDQINNRRRYWNLDMKMLSERFKDYYLIIDPIFDSFSLVLARKDCLPVSLEEAERLKDALSDMTIYYQNPVTGQVYKPKIVNDRMHYFNVEDSRHKEDASRNTHFYYRRVATDLLLSCQAPIR